ncbi:Calx-beta domain-containing protein [Shewanella sp.]|uniref:Calx-beta domain-containing protein n=1 Tax=Shewanella sp. TaxID=50422 RepID=UPI003A974B77
MKRLTLPLLLLATTAQASDIRPLSNNEMSAEFLAAAAANSSEETVVDIAVFYQPSFMATYGEYEGYRRIEAMVNVANASYQAHGLNYRLSIADVLPVESIPDDTPFQDVLDENGNIIQDGAEYLFSIAALNTGSPEYTAYQERLKADIVVYIREQRDADTVLGLGGIGGEYASVLDDGSDPERNSTLAHEIGHNIGMNHEAANAFVGPEYARAWTCGGMKTIMYSATTHADTLNHYSTPDMTYNGEACGDAETADNARVLVENFPRVSQRREGVAALGVVSFTDTVYSGNEQDGVNITLQRTGDISQAASVKVFAENGSAVWGEDFLDAYITANFAAGEDSATITYPMVSDGSAEGIEDFTLSLKYPYKLSVTEATAQAKVQDGNQTGYVGVFSISGATSITEGDNAEFVISRAGGTGEVAVNVKAVSGTAMAGSDYVELNQNVLFAEGQTSATVTFNTIDDTEYKSSKALTLVISVANDSAEYDVQELPITIIDNDPTPAAQGTFALTASASSVSESAGSVTLTITRTDGSADAVSMNVATQDGTAKAGTDYQAIDQDVTFAEGETTKTLSVGIMGNSSVDGSRTFTVNLSGEATISASSVILTITDDDSANNGQTGNESNESRGGGSLGGLGMFLLGITALLRRKRMMK